jgi:thioredoxin 1
MADNGLVRTFTDATFAAEVVRAEGLTVVDFWAAWCGPCRMLAPIVEQLAAEFDGRAAVGKLDVDANPATAARYNVRSIPSVLLFRDGVLVDTVVGVLPKRVLAQKVEDQLEPVAGRPA